MKTVTYLYLAIFLQLLLANPATATDSAGKVVDSSEFINNPEKLAEYWRSKQLEQEKEQREMVSICKKKGITESYNQECILNSMPGARNKVAVSEALEYCASKAPCNIVKSKRSGIFGVTSANGCFEKYGKHQSLAIAAHYIQAACYDLYEDK